MVVVAGAVVGVALKLVTRHEIGVAGLGRRDQLRAERIQPDIVKVDHT